jgi:hypothetical protein
VNFILAPCKADCVENGFYGWRGFTVTCSYESHLAGRGGGIANEAISGAGRAQAAPMACVEQTSAFNRYTDRFEILLSKAICGLDERPMR